MGIIFASGFLYLYLLSVQKPLLTSHGDERDKRGMQGRVKLLCMGYMQWLAPRSVVGQFVVVPGVTVCYCLFHGVLCFCVNVRIPLQPFLSCCLRSGACQLSLMGVLLLIGHRDQCLCVFIWVMYASFWGRL